MTHGVAKADNLNKENDRLDIIRQRYDACLALQNLTAKKLEIFFISIQTKKFFEFPSKTFFFEEDEKSNIIYCPQIKNIILTSKLSPRMRFLREENCWKIMLS